MKIAVLALIMLVFVSGAARAQSPLWHDLKPGPYATGFKVVWKYDYSRTWTPQADYQGHPLPGATARPIRISLWYPARKNGPGAPMPYSGYLHVAVPPSLSEFNQRIEEYDLTSVRNIFKSAAAFDALLKTPTAATLNARPAVGSFPLVVFSLGQNDHTLENTVLWEYLASHGYVVATVPHLGTSPRRFQLLVHDPLSYEAQVRDLEFVIQQLHDLPYVQADKLALMGHSFGGVYSLLAAMRNSNVDAVIGLDPTYMSKIPSFFYKYWEAPDYDAGRLKAPMLVLYKGSEPENLTSSIVDGLVFSDRYLIKFPHLIHADFNSYPMIFALSPQDESPDRDYALKYRSILEGVKWHEIVCEYVLNFLDGKLKGNEAALHFVSAGAPGFSSELAQVEIKFGLKSPTEEEFYTIIQQQGLDAALKILRTAVATYPKAEVVREATMQRIGKEAGYYGKSAVAVDVFQFNVAAHPDSATVYGDLADAYAAADNKAAAIANYQKALKLDPQNNAIKEKLEKLNPK